MINLSVKNLVKEFAGGSRAVDQINFTVPEGSLFTLLGPSGCGKTTTLRMIAGLESPTSGQILFGDEDYTTFPPHRREIGMVFQSYALFPHMSVYENVAYGLKIRNVNKTEMRQRVEKVLELVGLAHTIDRKPSQLSGGQQQRIALARALVYEPKILLLDEPLSNLDAKLRVYMREEIRKVQKKAGITTVYVTHDQEEALSISDYIAVMHGGRISQLGKSYDIYEKPSSVLVADFIGKANFLDVEIRGNEADTFQVALEGSDIRVASAQGEADSFSQGKQAILFFRPEKVSLATQPVEGKSIQCNITHILYLGETVRYTVKLASGKEVNVSLNRRIESLTEGSTGYLVLNATDGILFPFEQKNLLNGGN
ncbi:MAG TPA: ABC transporter ATP-binding protein [Bacillota bacterium]|nr:ABC transporter ATP-binding protein [Bacillota bacterium]